MKIKHDYSYISDTQNKLIQDGLAEINIHSLNFDRYFTVEEQDENMRQSKLLSREDWNIRCDNTAQMIYKQLLPIAQLLDNKYDIHQFTEEKSSIDHYRSDWDLHFYSNAGWNEKYYFDHMKISFNTNRSPAQNNKLLEEILKDLEHVDGSNVQCRIQYNVSLDNVKIETRVRQIYEKLKDKFVVFQGMEGKVKDLKEYSEDLVGYGFFKKGSKKKYYQMNNAELLYIV